MPQIAKSAATRRERVGNAAWTAGGIILTLIKLPLWLLYFIPQQLRQHPKWSYRQAVTNELMRAFLYHSSVLQMRTSLSLEPGVEKELFVRMPPQDPRFYSGVLTDGAVQPCVIGGIWFPTVYQPGSHDERNTVLYFHGGAFVIGDGRLAVSGFAAATLAKSFDAKVLSFSYRLSSNPNCQFPAALQDAVTAYAYLLDQGVDARRIILAGDSAGCNLAITLLRYIADNNGTLLPHPVAAVLCSPWVDVFLALDPGSQQRHEKSPADYVPSNLQSWGARTYVPSHLPASDKYISPNRQPFRTKAALWICLGGLEILRDEGISFAEMMRAEGNRVEVYIEPYANHAILGVGNITGFDKEAEKAVKRAGEWVLECRS
ncbi:hypothetical protein IMSHALPRED_000825 [Imshaugia aleurites]|uniref:Alpha/beta hydrolase fold-3 domain-containing protein n=1 Tax=Imshaugia aleurites TaxID=172621 RepID=A0A8H3PE87_9LECA|nr:hypothetical protein IMSHALPRED_000825 [Imshaugia aleurites]